ncbi:MAG: hypothetical protein DRJ51_04325 [Thermoprotei archaeon]|nr:MAG: hypothetical protein DRJ51_04325 [Thermoprotei archaeon]RLF01848.1 MAG: hypothetical protein DRJ59_05125 [Thermoprotei archaeon]
MKPFTRLGLVLILAGLTVLGVVVLKSEKHVARATISVKAGEFETRLFYLYERDVRVLVEVIPSVAKVDIEVLDVTQYLKFIRGESYSHVYAVNGTSSIDFNFKPLRGVYVFVFRNSSGKSVLIRLTIVMEGFEKGCFKVGVTLLAIGLVLIAVLKVLQRLF